MGIFTAVFAKILASGGGALTGFVAFLTQQTWLAAILLKPIQGFFYVFGQVAVKNFMRKRKQLAQEIHDAELDVGDLSLKPTIDVYRTKYGMVTQRMKKMRKLNRDILALWRFCKRYNIAFGGEQGVQLMKEVEEARRKMSQSMSKFPELQSEMTHLRKYYDCEDLEVEDRQQEKVMRRVNAWAPVGKWLRIGLYVFGFYFACFWLFDWLYGWFAQGSNLYAYMVNYASDVYPNYSTHVEYYHTNFHEPLKWVLTIVGGFLLIWKRLFVEREVYVEFTRKTYYILLGLAILALGVAFVTVAMHYVLPLIQEGGFVYEVFLKDYPDFASWLSKIAFGLIVLIGWGYLTYKSAKKLFFDPRKVVVLKEHSEKAEEFYANQKEICKQYTVCAQCYYMLVISIECTRDEKEAVFDGFEDYDILMAKAKNEDKFFDEIATEEVMEELDEILPTGHAYKESKLNIQ